MLLKQLQVIRATYTGDLKLITDQKDRQILTQFEHENPTFLTYINVSSRRSLSTSVGCWVFSSATVKINIF
jgi:hypothetical protein